MSPTIIYEALKKLGGNPDTVARRLKEAGIRGKRHDNECCPIARFINERFKPHFVDVHTEFIDCDVGQIETPPAVAQFIERFDTCYYPELEDDE
jgi:hypothetical protein